jgi:ribosomal protein S17E
MLIYHPAYDAYHCVFRLLLIINSLGELEVSKLKILDFYLVFPKEISNIRLPSDKTHIRSAINKLNSSYRGPVNSKQAFRDMSHIQNAVIRSLGAMGLINQASLLNNYIKRTEKELSPDFLEAFENFLTNQTEVSEFTLNELSKISLNGINGLKDRTGLMEYRYDNL